MSATNETIGSSSRRRQWRRRSQPPHRSSYQLIVGDEFRSLDTCSMSPRRTLSSVERRAAVFSQAMALASQGDLQRLKAFAVAENIDLNGANRRGWRLVQVAAECGYLHIVLWLLDAGVDGDARDALGWSPLMLAASRDCVAVVHALLQRGCHRSLTESIRVAAVNNCLHSLYILLGHTHVKGGRCDRGRCPVRLSAERRQYGAVQALLVAGYSTRCLRHAPSDYELDCVVKMAAGARRVLARGLKGLVVSALIDDRGPMRISIHLMWSGIEVRLRRGRNMFFRRRAQPMLTQIGYDENIRLLSHDALLLGPMTVKLNASGSFSSQHLIIALRQRQLARSESFPIVVETNELVHLMKTRVPDLVAARLENHSALSQISAALPGANSVILRDALRLAGRRLSIDSELKSIRGRLSRSIDLANDIGTILQDGQRLAESGNDFAQDAPPRGKQTRVQRELDKVYVCRTQLQALMTSLSSLDAIRETRTASLNDSVSQLSAAPTGLDDEMCQQCNDSPALVAFESCRHLGLCKTCHRDRRQRRSRCLICHERVDMIVSNALNSQI